MVVLGSVVDLGLARHVAAQHGHRVAFPVTVANLVALLKGPGAKVVLLIPPLAEARGDTLARALRRLHPRVPVALSLGTSAVDPDMARLMWLTSAPIADDTLQAGAQIGGLAAVSGSDVWDGATWEVEPLRDLVARARETREGRRVVGRDRPR